MSIVVCVPWVKANKYFMDDFLEWYALNKQQYGLVKHFKMYRPLHEVQAGAVELARKIGASHVLFVEDDQSAFPQDGLEYLLAEDKDVIGFPTYFKEYPYYSMAMRKRDPNISFLVGESNLQPVAQAGGPVVQKVDLITWAFTLVKTSVFDRLEADPFAFTGEPPADSYFCEYCERAGIDRWIHFGALIHHGDVDPELIPHLRRMYAVMAAERERGVETMADLSGYAELKMREEKSEEVAA